MAEDTLKGLNLAILVTDGFEQVELTEPRKALDEPAPQRRCSREPDSNDGNRKFGSKISWSARRRPGKPVRTMFMALCILS